MSQFVIQRRLVKRRWDLELRRLYAGFLTCCVDASRKWLRGEEMNPDSARDEVLRLYAEMSLVAPDDVGAAATDLRDRALSVLESQFLDRERNEELSAQLAPAAAAFVNAARRSLGERETQIRV